MLHQKIVLALLSLLLFSFIPINNTFAQQPELDVGGAVRLNYGWKDYGDDSNGSFDFELFRIDVKVSEGKWFLDAQYRWYQGFEAIHHAEVGYRFDEQDILVAGVTQVPFGIEPYASHSFWFGGTYYLGLEDDYDTGIKWRHIAGDWTFDSAYFFNAEYDNASRWERYSFDVSATYEGAKSNREDGQLNGRAQYQWGKHTLGASVQLGRFINSHSEQSGRHWAAGVHIDAHFDGGWNLQGQSIVYDYETDTALETADSRIALSAFEFPFEIAARATVTSLNLAKIFTVNNDFADSITCYNDATYIDATNQSGLQDSLQNVTGCNIAKGGLYTYIDWIAGKNMWFAGGPGVGINNGDNRWHSRLNINIGYYF